MEIKNNGDLRGSVALVTALLNNICNATSPDAIRSDFDQVKKIATNIANYKLKTLSEGK